MLGLCTRAAPVHARMTGDPFVLEVQRDEAVCGVQLQLFTHQMVWCRLQMGIVLHVVINVQFHLFDVGVLVGLPR